MLLDVADALIVEGLDFEQRERFEEEFTRALGGTEGDADQASRRAYALAHGEQR